MFEGLRLWWLARKLRSSRDPKTLGAVARVRDRRADHLLVGALQDSSSSWARVDAVRVVGETANLPPDVLKPLLQALWDEDEKVRSETRKVVAGPLKHVAPAAIADLLRNVRCSVSDRGRLVFDSAVLALNCIGTPAATKTLAEVVASRKTCLVSVLESDDSWQRRSLAALLLKELNWKPTSLTQRVAWIITNGTDSEALTSGEGGVCDALLQCVADGKRREEERSNAMKAVRKARYLSAVPILLDVAANANRQERLRIRLCAMEAIGSIGMNNASVVESLRAIATHPQERLEIRVAAMRTLNSIGDSMAVTLLLDIAVRQEVRPEIRCDALGGIAEAAPRSVVPILIGISKDAHVLSSVVAALAAIGDVRGLGALAAFLQEDRVHEDDSFLSLLRGMSQMLQTEAADAALEDLRLVCKLPKQIRYNSGYEGSYGGIEGSHDAEKIVWIDTVEHVSTDGVRQFAHDEIMRRGGAAAIP